MLIAVENALDFEKATWDHGKEAKHTLYLEGEIQAKFVCEALRQDRLGS
jgi:hypothetical protein